VTNKTIDPQDRVKRFENVEAVKGTGHETQEGGVIVLHNGLPLVPMSANGAAAKAIETSTSTDGAAVKAIETPTSTGGAAVKAIETFNLTKVYNGKIRAVDDLNLAINEGEIFGLLGPNGAGKTTTIRMLVTLTRPTSGRAVIDGYDLAKDARTIRQIIGYSSQEAGVDENATGREYLALFGKYYHLDGQTIKRRIDEVLELMELADAADRLVSTYSGGMRKRLEIATALINKPKILIFDEPTLGLDVQTRLRIWDYIRELSKEDTTILLTTHYLEETDKLCDRVAIIDHGKIVALGTPEELKGEISGDAVVLALPLQEPDQLAKTIDRAKQLLSPQSFVKDVVARDGGLNVYVDEGSSAVPQILRVLEEADVKVEGITLTRPSLDDVFVKYTGRTLREEKGTARGALGGVRPRGGR